MHIIWPSKIQISKRLRKWQKRLLIKKREILLFLILMDGFLYKRGKLKEAAKVMESVIKSGENLMLCGMSIMDIFLKKEKRCE